ncbi:MAG: toll/interleukin-1 receptor domain-containing protein [Desulfobacteraceae bacterium]|nr:toll/interleukin-1 receptor domain-containing protein [Desulfobacteraceae bacterium]
MFKKLKKSKKKLFISYASEDRNTAMKLYEDLKRENVEPWLDAKKLIPGQNWKTEVNRAIKESSNFLILLSFHSISKRGYVQKEQKIALELLDEFPHGDIFIIPVRLDECEPLDERLNELHWVNLFDSYENGLEQILHAVTKRKIPIRKTSGTISREVFTPTVCGVCRAKITNRHKKGGKCLTPDCNNIICNMCWNAERTRHCTFCKEM